MDMVNNLARDAAKGGHTKTLKVLKEIGADMNAKDNVCLSILNYDYFNSNSQINIHRVMMLLFCNRMVKLLLTMQLEKVTLKPSRPLRRLVPT